MAPAHDTPGVPPPVNRRLRAFAFDPVLSHSFEYHDINEVVISLPWFPLAPGPCDDYIEVIDHDPASQCFYAPVDLNAPFLLAQDGLPPSESNPQFHQQMVYTVARTTILHFEQALGRRLFWSPYRGNAEEQNGEFVDHLRIYPHALREANAYYSPQKKALLFGYFPATHVTTGLTLPGGTTFTCLSHDIVAHETTHALVDGLHPRFVEPSNIDVLALHEAIADLVALFQHFTYPTVLRQQIAKTRGDLAQESLLAQVAFEFGQAVGQYGALRSAIGHYDKDHIWKRTEPDPEKLAATRAPHQRGAILVAALFDAFLTIYNARSAPLLRIATGGTGILPAGHLHPARVEKLAEEAAKTAKHFLRICIRALDYCPPVDIDFGDYLRAIITADYDLVPDDPHRYRQAIIEACRRHGIYPRDVRNLSEESLRWQGPDEKDPMAFEEIFGTPDKLRELVVDWGVTQERADIDRIARDSRIALHGLIINAYRKMAERGAAFSHIVLDPDRLRSIWYRGELPAFEVHAVRPAHRANPDGFTVTELVIEITQRRRGYYDPAVQDQVDQGKIAPPKPDFIFRGGCTLIVEPQTAKVRYCIYKNIRSNTRLQRTREYLTTGSASSLRAAYFGNESSRYFTHLLAQGEAETFEPFALLHRSFLPEEVAK